jgi:hypothetical protein
MLYRTAFDEFIRVLLVVLAVEIRPGLGNFYNRIDSRTLKNVTVMKRNQVARQIQWDLGSIIWEEELN